MRKLYAAMLIVLLSLLPLALSGCTSDDGPGVFVHEDFGGWEGEIQAEFGWTGLDFNHEGRVTLTFWGLGPGNFREDVGRIDHDPTDGMSRHTSAVMAAARIFNQYFPYVVINAQNGGVTAPAERQAFFLAHGFH